MSAARPLAYASGFQTENGQRTKMMVEIENACPLYDSFRVQQVAGMFDVPLAEKLSERFSIDLPPLGDEWRIGLDRRTVRKR